ncbi:MAG: Na+/H+ antiporter NhaA [Arenimonas sp.]
MQIRITETFTRFVESEKSSALLLLGCTAFSLFVANSALGPGYAHFWQLPVVGMSLQHWINDGLMAVFFLLIGLELEREIYSGELSSLRNALLPIVAALGGIVTPAAIHYAFNMGTPTQPGVGIPMATDIAFALGVLAILGSRVPVSLKIFVVAFAVIDDLGAIIIIATLYTAKVSALYLAAAAAAWLLMFGATKWLRWMQLAPYLLGGMVLWWLMLKSGVHATLAGVLLAFAIPYSSRSDDETSPSHRLEHLLHKPVAFLILPLFALANTGVVIGGDWTAGLTSANGLGIVLGLVLGKPLGVVVFCWLAIVSGVAGLPDGMRWSHLVGAGMLGGIGFTMAIFIGSMAFASDPVAIDASKLAVFVASLAAGVLGYGWLRWVAPPGR